ncbi:predicted protein [Postia placenta Mad-698-R]|uniref:Fido domain-containing protein n=1 Tax=Postia placenta MAD-698-R-SB12 TaxID=670580 RepID=A0A1X6MXW6_9APHY|nr:hypothetical protein POSPLADRAFT_1146550 [Postia placenta MAD-698-R-SB12]EED78005.1 predicted protein [Postia placenta Mad-698-R]OSX61215.1 hypothetical protein POSPLADRAFT_1146550 [Postia placenta MAD-698-R-SB12]
MGTETPNRPPLLVLAAIAQLRLGTSGDGQVHSRLWNHQRHVLGLLYGLVITLTSATGHPFMDGNKRTAFFLGTAYLRAQGLPGWVDDLQFRKDVFAAADRFIDAATGKLDVEGLAGGRV